MGWDKSFGLKIFVISLGILSFAEFIKAQDNNTTIDTILIDPITVTATRVERPLLSTPYAIDVITADTTAGHNLDMSLEEKLSMVPGVFVNDRNNLEKGDRISIRGMGSRSSFGVRGIKIIQDNIPLTMPDGQSQVNNMDLGSAGEIEILRGPSSSLYGNASGGIINIMTGESDSSLSLTPGFMTGSYGLNIIQARGVTNQGENSINVALRKIKRDGYVEHSDASFSLVNIVGRHQFNELLSSTAVFNFCDAPYLLNPSSLTKEDFENFPTKARNYIVAQGAGEKVRQGQGGFTLDYNFKNGGKASGTIYYISRDLLNPIPGRIIKLDRSSWGFRSIVTVQPKIMRVNTRVAAGLDIESQIDKRKEFINLGLAPAGIEDVRPGKIFNLLRYGNILQNQHEDVWGIGPFISSEIELSKRFSADLGIRYDNYRFQVKDINFNDTADESGRRNMSRLSPMAGMVYRPATFAKVYFNYSTAFQTPTTTELGNRSDGRSGFNPDLMPEKIGNFEFGTTMLSLAGAINFSTALYWEYIDDMIVPFQIPNQNTDEVYYRNAAKAKNIGLEIKTGWKASKSISISGAYTFSNFTFRDYLIESEIDSTSIYNQLRGNKIPGVPQNNLNLEFTYHHQSGLFAGIDWQWTGEYFTNDYNGPPPGINKSRYDFINDSYMKTDIRTGLRHQFAILTADVFGGINNVFNVSYCSSIIPNAAGDRFFEPSPGRNYYLGMTLSLSSRR